MLLTPRLDPLSDNGCSFPKTRRLLSSTRESKLEDSEYCSSENWCRKSLESKECRQWWHSPSAVRMSFCLMLWMITTQFFANKESLESQKKQPRNNWNMRLQRVYLIGRWINQTVSQRAWISDKKVDVRSRMPLSEYTQCIKVRAAVLPNKS